MPGLASGNKRTCEPGIVARYVGEKKLSMCAVDVCCARVFGALEGFCRRTYAAAQENRSPQATSRIAAAKKNPLKSNLRLCPAPTGAQSVFTSSIPTSEREVSFSIPCREATAGKEKRKVTAISDAFVDFESGTSLQKFHCVAERVKSFFDRRLKKY